MTFPSCARPVRIAVPLLALSLAACSSVESFLAGDKVDYRSQSAKTTPLEIPPDLTQLARDGRFVPQGSVVSANALRQTSASGGAAAVAVVAPASVGDMRLERLGNQRWLLTTQTPERLWPQLRAFWLERGFTLAVDSPEIGVMETEWAEDRAKLPQDFIRRTFGRVLDAFYSTGTRDRYRTRVERTGAGTEIHISHRGLEEVYSSSAKDATTWQPRASDPQLEGEFLSRLMVNLGPKEGLVRDASTALAAPGAVPSAAGVKARARLQADAAATLAEVDEPFDRAWRRVGLALDRGGFTVEDRDRSAGLYFVRYVDPKSAGKDEPNFFAKLFSSSKSPSSAVQRFRIALTAAGDSTRLAILNAQGVADSGEAARSIGTRLVEELK